MAFRQKDRVFPLAGFAGVFALLIILLLTCGCLQTEPEELPPQPAPAVVVPGETLPATTMIPVTVTGTPGPIDIIRPKETRLVTGMDFPPEVIAAVDEYADGSTADTINGFLRWESVRARTSQPEAARIRGRIGLIDYAFFNTTLRENTRVYVGVTGEQARRILNDSVYSESGYVSGSYDPSVVYQELSRTGRDREGYLSMCVIDFKKGNHLLFVNETKREFLLQHGGIWDVAGVDMYEKMEYAPDAIPLFEDTVPTKVRLIYTREHP